MWLHHVNPQKNIIHGDLNPNNVLLKRDPSSSRGVVCKLCDFGLSVKMAGAGFRVRGLGV